MDKLDLILEKLDKMDVDINSLKSDNKTFHGKFDKMDVDISSLKSDNDVVFKKLEKLDKMEADINSLKSDNKTFHKKFDMIIDEVASIKEQITDHDIKIKVINSKTKAL